MSKRRKLLFIVLGILLLIQFIPIDRNTPVVDPNLDFAYLNKDMPEGAALLKSTCYDCHSYETEYPWYAYVAPVSLWLKSHVKGARMKMNFSEWGNYTGEEKRDLIDEAIEEIEDKSMPLKSYTWLHPPSRMSDAERKILSDFLDKQAR